MLSGITITCFAASYLVTLALELSRLFFRAPVRVVLIVGMTVAGLFAHTAYLVTLVSRELHSSGEIAPFSSWYDWCLLAAWFVAVGYLLLFLRRPQNAVGLFLLPLELVLILLAAIVRDVAPFDRGQAHLVWRSIHAGALLLGTVAVTLGFAAGLMYLVQSYRLKQKLPPRQGLRLPSLEWLQTFNLRALWASTGFLAGGLLSGITMNLIRQANRQATVAWSDPVVLSSTVLFLWLVSASVFEWLYKPARQGRKVAYLTLASFVFLALVLSFVLSGRHAAGGTALRRRPILPITSSADTEFGRIGRIGWSQERSR